jgi:hypothetical protein
MKTTRLLQVLEQAGAPFRVAALEVMNRRGSTVVDLSTFPLFFQEETRRAIAVCFAAAPDMYRMLSTLASIPETSKIAHEHADLLGDIRKLLSNMEGKL